MHTLPAPPPPPRIHIIDQPFLKNDGKKQTAPLFLTVTIRLIRLFLCSCPGYLSLTKICVCGWGQHGGMGQVKGTGLLDDTAKGEEWVTDKPGRGGRAACGERRGASRRAVRLVTHPNHHDGLLDNVRYTDLRRLCLRMEPIQSIGQPLPIHFLVSLAGA